MTKEPRRLSQSGGASQRLLDSASLDVPSRAARQRAALLAATASSFASTSSGAVPVVARTNVVKTLATWIFVGAAASGTLALLGSKLLGPTSEASASRAAAPVLAELPAPSAQRLRSPEIAPEPSPAPAVSALATDSTPESMALRIRALRSSGKTSEARALASVFLTKYPAHPLASQVKSAGQ